MALDFPALAHQCAPQIELVTIQALAKTESSFNPYAIGVVKGVLDRQPKSLNEAIATAKMLESKGYDFSVGLVQVNRRNFGKYGLSLEAAFDPCKNLRAGSHILSDCFKSAKVRFKDEQAALGAAFSCYYSGNFQTGFNHGYVQTVVANALGQRPMPRLAGMTRKAPSLKPAPQRPAEREIVLPPSEGVQVPLLAGQGATKPETSSLVF